MMTEKLVLSPMEEINSLNAVVDPSTVKRVAVSNERINELGKVVAAPVQAAAAPVAPVVPPVSAPAPETPIAPISSGVSQGVVDAVNNFYSEGEKDSSLTPPSLENPISNTPGMEPSFGAPQRAQVDVPSLNPLGNTSNMTESAPSSFVPEYRPEPVSAPMGETVPGGSLGVEPTAPSSFVPEYRPEPVSAPMGETVPGGSLGVEPTAPSSFVPEYRPEPISAPMGETVPGGSLGVEPTAPSSFVPEYHPESVSTPMGEPVAEAKTEEPVETPMPVEEPMMKTPQPDMISMSEDDEIMNLRAILESTKRAAEEQEIRTEMAIEYLDRYLESKKSMSR